MLDNEEILARNNAYGAWDVGSTTKAGGTWIEEHLGKVSSSEIYAFGLGIKQLLKR